MNATAMISIISSGAGSGESVVEVMRFICTKVVI